MLSQRNAQKTMTDKINSVHLLLAHVNEVNLLGKNITTMNKSIKHVIICDRGRSQWPRRLRHSGFESRWEHGCVSRVPCRQRPITHPMESYRVRVSHYVCVTKFNTNPLDLPRWTKNNCDLIKGNEIMQGMQKAQSRQIVKDLVEFFTGPRFE